MGVPLGCVAGISATVAAAKPLGLAADAGLHSAIYYAIFLGFTGWALLRGGPRAANELLPLTAIAFILVPLASMLFGEGFTKTVWLVDVLALLGGAASILLWRSARKRTGSPPRDSVWSLDSASAHAPG